MAPFALVIDAPSSQTGRRRFTLLRYAAAHAVAHVRTQLTRTKCEPRGDLAMNRCSALRLVGAGSLTALSARPASAADTMRLAAPALDATALMFYANDQKFF